jgi:transposase-like protein
MARKHQRHSWLIRRQVAKEYLEGGRTLKELSVRYNVPYQTIWDWTRSYDSEVDQPSKVATFNVMTSEEQKAYEALKKENEALRKQLEFAQMKGVAMETIIDLAKEEYGIDLLKNSGARQSVKSKTPTRRQK